MNTITALGIATELSCSDPEKWDSYWIARGMEPKTLTAVLQRATTDYSDTALAAAMTAFSLGFELGKLSCDPSFGLDPVSTPLKYRCPVDACSFRSGVNQYRGHIITCPSHGNPVVPTQEGWE